MLRRVLGFGGAHAVPRGALALLCMLVVAAWACNGGSPTRPSPTPPTNPPVEPPPPPPPPEPPPPPPPVPRLTITRFMAFGDSLTEGVVSPALTILRRLNAADAYPARLQAMLAARYTAQTPVVLNRGAAGETAQHGATRFVSTVRSDSPEAVLLLEGVNDIAADGQRGLSAAVAAMDVMMKEARNRGVAVFVATLPPERPGAPKAIDSALRSRYSEDLRRLARGEGAVLVDLERDLDESLVGIDGLHLTEAGYERVAAIFMSAISATKEAPPSPSTAPAPTASSSTPPSASTSSTLTSSTLTPSASTPSAATPSASSLDTPSASGRPSPKPLRR